MCVYQATQDGSWGLTFMISITMTFKLCRDDLAWESFDFSLQALFDC
jgi:hypothetical protein